MQIKFVPDQPIQSNEADSFGFNSFVTTLKEALYQTTPPFVYGVLGDWGVGKTSILRLLEKQLNEDLAAGEQTFIPIWFNPWEYENESNMIYPLLYAIKADYENKELEHEALSGKFIHKMKKVVGASAFVAANFSLGLISNRTLGEKLSLKELQEQLKQLQEKNSPLDDILYGWTNQVAEFKQAFTEVLDAYALDLQLSAKHPVTDASKVKFVFLIDDLDRCLPDTTIAILENIKNHLTTKNCIFVLGLNPQIVYQGIRIKYKNLAVNGREYLEKILNYSFFVPEPTGDHIHNFVHSQFAPLTIINEADKENVARYFNIFAATLEDARFHNPRKIKRILNRYLFFLSKYKDQLESKSEEQPQKRHSLKLIVRLIILGEYFPQIFALLLNKKGAAAAIKQLKEIGNKDKFDIDQFENDFGVSIKNEYAQLVKMNGLFNIDTANINTHFPLHEQAAAVHQLTRGT